MIYLVGILSVATVASALVLRKRSRLFEVVSKKPDATNSVGAVIISGWTKKKEVKIALAAAVGVPLAMLLVFWLLIPGGAGWMLDNIKVSIGIGVVVAGMVLVTLIPFKLLRAAAFLCLLIALVAGVGFNLPWAKTMPETKDAPAAATSADPFNTLIAQVEVPPGGVGELVWSDRIALPNPNGPETVTRIRKDSPVTIRVFGPDGKPIPERSISNSRNYGISLLGLPEGSTIQAASLVPGKGSTIRIMAK